jgi:two-component system, response regulator
VRVVTKDILLVEDNSDDQLLTLRALKKHNISNEVVVASDGEVALNYLFAGDCDRFGLILLDMNLPKVDGIEVLRKIREADRTRLIPVVVLTSSKLEQDIRASYDGGANAYVRKPVKLSEFTDAVGTLASFWLILNESVTP